MLEGEERRKKMDDGERKERREEAGRIVLPGSFLVVAIVVTIYKVGAEESMANRGFLRVVIVVVPC